MTGSPYPSSSEAEGFSAYERRQVETFFASALEARARLVGEIATARRRIAEARASLTEATDVEHSCIRAVLDAQRELRGEQRRNEKAIAVTEAEAEAEAEHIIARASTHAATILAAARRRPGNGAEATADRSAVHRGGNGAGGVPNGTWAHRQWGR